MGLVMHGHEDVEAQTRRTALLSSQHVSPKTLFERLKKAVIKEQRLLIAVSLAVLLLNVPYGRTLLYPFMLFSTWVHEMCHGMAALLVGGSIDELIIYQDGSGVAYTRIPDDELYSLRRVIVASAGYVGTSLAGGMLLIFRRTRRGPRVGLLTLSMLILLSCTLYVRSFFGIAVLIPMALCLMAAGWLLSDSAAGAVYAFMAVTCCLNAVLSIQELFGSDNWTVGGEPSTTDAHTVANFMYWPYWIIASMWFVFAIFCCLVGLIFGWDPSDPDDPEDPSGFCGAGSGVYS